MYSILPLSEQMIFFLTHKTEQIKIFTNWTYKHKQFLSLGMIFNKSHKKSYILMYTMMLFQRIIKQYATLYFQILEHFMNRRWHYILKILYLDWVFSEIWNDWHKMNCTLWNDWRSKEMSLPMRRVSSERINHTVHPLILHLFRTHKILKR